MPGFEMLCVYQFKVVLRGISPMIWRRLLLRSDHGIADLHYTIQIFHGGSDSHLHRFHIHGKDCGVAHEGGLTLSDDPERVREPRSAATCTTSRRRRYFTSTAAPAVWVNTQYV